MELRVTWRASLVASSGQLIQFPAPHWLKLAATYAVNYVSLLVGRCCGCVGFALQGLRANDVHLVVVVLLFVDVENVVRIVDPEAARMKERDAFFC